MNFFTLLPSWAWGLDMKNWHVRMPKQDRMYILSKASIAFAGTSFGKG